MIRQAIDNVESMNSFTFKYNNEDSQVSFTNETIDIEVDAGGSWMNVETNETKVKNKKDALKQAKKIIDNLNRQY